MCFIETHEKGGIPTGDDNRLVTHCLPTSEYWSLFLQAGRKKGPCLVGTIFTS